MGLSDLQGIEDLVASATTAVQASQQLNQAFPHALLLGPGGLGKTTFARAIADDMKDSYHEIEAADFKGRNDLLSFIYLQTTTAWILGQHALFFIDEIHRFAPRIQEALYMPLADGKINLKKQLHTLHPFTIIAATTNEEMLNQASFLSRFQYVWRFRPYKENQIETIVHKTLKTLNLHAENNVIKSIAHRSFGNPRKAKRLVTLLQHETLASKQKPSLTLLNQVLAREHIDAHGLEDDHRDYLKALKNADSPKGIRWIAAKIGRSVEITEAIIEPPLILLELVDRDAHGRYLTTKGKKYPL